MTLTLEQIAERLRSCEVDLEAHRAYLKAMEYALGAAIATHNDRRSLARVWNLMLVEAAECACRHRRPGFHRCPSAVSSDADRSYFPYRP